MSEESDRLVPAKEMARILGITTPTFRAYARAGQIPPPLKVGRRPRWSINEVLQHLKAQREREGQAHAS